MPTTSFDLTSVVTPILTSATTWANLRGASITDPIYFAANNQSAVPVRVTANAAATTANSAIPISSAGGTLNRTFTRKSIGLYALTSASTAVLIVETDR